MDPIKSELIKSLFQSSTDRDQLMRTVNELQNADAGRISLEDAMKIILDGFLSYARALEQKTQGEVDAIHEGSNKANEGMKTGLAVLQQRLDQEQAGAEALECQFKETIEAHKRTIKNLHGQNTGLHRQKQALESLIQDLECRSHDLGLEIDILVSENVSHSKKGKRDGKKIAQLEAIGRANTETVEHQTKEIISLKAMLEAKDMELKALAAKRNRPSQQP
ncbi:MAG: hypothetical protein Q9170_002435 [Blastenia crenularia]